MSLAQYPPHLSRVILFYLIVMCIMMNINTFKMRRKKVATSLLAELGFIHRFLIYIKVKLWWHPDVG